MTDPYADAEFAPVPAENSPHHEAARDLRAAAEGSDKTSIRDKAAGLKNEAAAKLDHLRDFAGEKAANVKAAAGEKAAVIQGKANESAQALRVSAENQWLATRAKADELEIELEQRIREEPFKAVLIAAAVGFFLGRSMRS